MQNEAKNMKQMNSKKSKLQNGIEKSIFQLNIISLILIFVILYFVYKDLTEAINQRDMNETYAKALNDKYDHETLRQSKGV